MSALDQLCTCSTDEDACPLHAGTTRIGPSACTGLPCENPEHDHTETDENDVTGPMVCADCGMPAHYDYGVELYQHDDPDAPDCFLIHDARPVTS